MAASARWPRHRVAPGLSWHGLHYLIRGSDALLLWGADGASRVLLSSGEGSDLGWRVPVLEVLEGAGRGWRFGPLPLSWPGSNAISALAAGPWGCNWP